MSRRSPHRFYVAIGATFAALALRLLLRPVMGADLPLLFFIPAILVAGWYGGLAPGLLATGLSGLAGSLFLLAPEFSSIVGTTTPARALALFILLGGAISGFTESLHRLVERERKSTEQAEQHAAELTRTQQERDALLAEAQELNRVKDEFLATLSHELRTPINAVLGWTQMLRAGMVQGDRVAAALETIERNAAAQQRLIEDLLDVSRIITGQFRMESLPVDLATVVRTSVQGVEPAALAKNIRITMAVAGEPIALGDPTRLQQAVWNLLSNAVKFTDHDGQVDVTVAAAGPSVEITVRDSGIGIAPEVLPRIFERFTQADGGTTRAHSGLGLGLAIVRHIVELHGGTVSGASEGAGRGAIFRIVVPAAVRIAADATPMSARDQTAADEAQMQRR